MFIRLATAVSNVINVATKHISNFFPNYQLLGVISRLLGDPIYETYACKSTSALWKIRDENTGLLGNVMNIKTGTWVSKVSRVCYSTWSVH